MHELAGRRLARFADRAELHLSDGSLDFLFESGAFDRVVANYVLDLLPADDIEVFLSEAYRLLTPAGLLCLTSLTNGATGTARLVTHAWQCLWRFRPELVGGCRAVRLTDYLSHDRWELRHPTVLTTLGISSEVNVASPRT